MIESDEQWLAIADAFHAAALGAGSWLDALAQLARATGSRAGELIGLGSEHAVPFNWVAGIDREWTDEFIAIDGGNPAINPFVRAGVRARPLEVLASSDFVTPEERRHGFFLADFCRRHDTVHICLSPLIKEQDSVVGLAVIRSASEGEITAQQRKLFAALAPHVRAAVRTQIALEHQGAALIAGTLEALSIAAFVCDRSGTVKAMTPTAEALVGTGKAVRLRQGRLRAANAVDDRRLAEEIDTAVGTIVRPQTPRGSVIVVHGTTGEPLALTVVPLPRTEYTFGFDPRVLVVARTSGMQNPAQTQALLQSAYGLTAAEAEVALRLGDGDRVEDIAETRGVSVNTVRVQIRNIFGKLGVRRQSELVARIRHLQ